MKETEEGLVGPLHREAAERAPQEGPPVRPVGRRCPGLVLLAGWGLLLVVRAAVADPPTPAEKDIRRVLDDQVKAWNKGDLPGYMRGYWKSPELTFSSGKDHTRGWQQTLERYRKRYQGEGREMGKLSFSDLVITPLGPDSAFVRGRWQLVRSKDRPGGLFTLIVRRFPEGWRIVHDHTSS